MFIIRKFDGFAALGAYQAQDLDEVREEDKQAVACLLAARGHNGVGVIHGVGSVHTASVNVWVNLEVGNKS